MSLTWTLKKVKDFGTVCYEDVDRGDGKSVNQMKCMTENLIWMTVPVGMGEITEVNHQEFYRRIHAWEEKNGAQIHFYDGKELQDVFTTLEDVKAHVGLATNASRMNPRQFQERLDASV
jgi:hypothetical protein